MGGTLVPPIGYAGMSYAQSIDKVLPFFSIVNIFEWIYKAGADPGNF